MSEQPAGIRAFDLQPPGRRLAPVSAPMRMTPAQHRARLAEMEAEKKARESRLTTELAEAAADHAALRDRIPRPAAATVAVLIIHQPWKAYGDRHIGCTECIEADGYEDTRSVDWPCDTYKAIKENTPT